MIIRESILLKNYKIFLMQSGLSKSTVDNYIVDALKFLEWLASTLNKKNYIFNKQIPSTYVSFANNKYLESYRSYLIHSLSSKATINRRVVSLKKFFNFIVSSGYLTDNPAVNLKTVSFASYPNHKGILTEFQEWLKKQEVTNTTIKNYISDVRHFLKYVERN